MSRVISIDDKYYAIVPLAVALDFSAYFVKRGIPATYTCQIKGDERELSFNKDASFADVMLGWIHRWEEGHEYCPFCGGVPLEDTDESGEKIRCSTCGCSTIEVVGPYYHKNIQAAWERWDRRSH